MALTKLSTSKRFITMIIYRTYLDIIPILFKFAGSFYFDSTLSNSFKLFPPQNLKKIRGWSFQQIFDDDHDDNSHLLSFAIVVSHIDTYSFNLSNDPMD